MRAAVLGAVALIAIALALALTHHSRHTSNLPAAAGDWYSALAAPYAPSKGRSKSACGVAIGAKTIGVAHPVLPCGVKLYVEYNGKQVLTQVIDRGHTVPGREFDLTQALAKLLHVEGTQTIQWRFAR
ncbi:MAG: rare lipoprotein [Gaiellaceae bacterium]|jgi:rare lipoprotein A (peptidoglycan hydrolase)|nr:rare lipoprotein [Gaiellaceae bacterium]MDX6473657.1 rare lipoprotein [Gaiellaceae bacterium]